MIVRFFPPAFLAISPTSSVGRIRWKTNSSFVPKICLPKIVLTSLAVVLCFPSTSRAEETVRSQKFFEAQASKSWRVLGSKYPKGSESSDVCYARREWGDGSELEFVKDLKDGTLSFWFKNNGLNYVIDPDNRTQQIRANLYRADGTFVGGANWAALIVSKNEILIPGFDDSFVQFLGQGDVLKLIPPGNAPNSEIVFENSIKVILARMRDCVRKYPSVAETDPFTGKAQSDIPTLELPKVGPTPSPPSGTEKSVLSDKEIKITDRNAFAASDRVKIASVAKDQQLELPEYAFAETMGVQAFSSFIGVWSNERGWNNGSGRHVMLIVTEVSNTGRAKGFYIWGPPTKQSWNSDKPGSLPFDEQISDDQFTIKIDPQITVKLASDRRLVLTAVRSGRPADQATINLSPIWQAVRKPSNARADFGKSGR